MQLRLNRVQTTKASTGHGVGLGMTPSFLALIASCTRYKIQLYMTKRGENLHDELQSLARMFTIMLIASENDKKRGVKRDALYSLCVTRLNEALVRITSMSDNYFSWEPDYAALMDDGMDASVIIARKTTTPSLMEAQEEVERL